MLILIVFSPFAFGQSQSLSDAELYDDIKVIGKYLRAERILMAQAIDNSNEEFQPLDIKAVMLIGNHYFDHRYNNAQQGINANKRLMLDFLDYISDLGIGNIDLTLIEGRNLLSDNVNNKLRSIANSNPDVTISYLGVHGAIDNNDQRYFILADGERLYKNDIDNTLRMVNSRLLISLSETCAAREAGVGNNKESNINFMSHATLGGFSDILRENGKDVITKNHKYDEDVKNHLIRLFSSAGTFDVVSSRTGYFSVVSAEGGFFTNSVIKALTNTKNYSYHAIAREIQDLTSDMFKRQYHQANLNNISSLRSINQFDQMPLIYSFPENLQ